MTKQLYLFAALSTLMLFSAPAFATHNVAGEIIYQFTGPNTIQASIITYTKTTSFAADRDSLTIHWGDSSPDDIIVRVNGPINPNGVPDGESLGNDIKKNIYIGTHTYSTSQNYYVISMTDPNRTDGILNINGGAAVGVPFYMEDTVWFHGQGLDHSPVLLYPPIDFANVGDTFFHNPTAYDVEADSMTFELTTPLQGLGNVVPLYVSPDRVISGAGDTITIDKLNGMVTWASPQQSGIYNIAILVREYRYGVLLGTVTRDMLIIVMADTSRRAPLNGYYVDTTIYAGQHFDLTCFAPDVDPAHINTLTATGGPFILSANAASFSSTPAMQPTGLMTWTPGHNLYKRRETSIITIQSLTNTSPPFTTLRSFRITVEDSLYTGIADAPVSHSFVKLYPNPTTDKLIINTSLTDFDISISDMTGRVCTAPYFEREIDISSLPIGVYSLRLQSREGSITKRFIKE